MARCRDFDEAREVNSLKEISLFSVITNFERFYSELVSSECNIPRDHREILTQFFSDTILCGLKCKRKLKAEFLDILINPHLRNLDMERFDEVLFPYLLNKLQTHGNTILSLKAHALDVQENLWEPLTASLPNLKHISFKDVPSHRTCKAIGRNCAFLKFLEIDDYLFIDSSGCRRYDGIAFIMSKCDDLEILQHPDTVGALYTMHKNDLPLMRKQGETVSNEYRKYMLTHLSSTFREYPLHDALEICAAMCPYVTHLRIDKLISDKELQKISHFSLLEALQIEDIHTVSVNCFNEFLKIGGSKLLRLELPHAPCLSVADLIKTCPQLQSLKLHGDREYANHPSPDDSSCEATLSNLENVEYLHGHFKNKENAEALKLLLSAAKNIKKLSLCGSTGLTNELVRSLHLYSVCELDVALTDIKADPLRELLVHGSLQVLDIKECENINEADYESLTTYSDKLRIVDIYWRTRKCFVPNCSPIYTWL